MLNADHLDELVQTLRTLDPLGATDLLEPLPDADIAQALEALGPPHGVEILEEFPSARRARVAAAARAGIGEQWLRSQGYAEGTLGRLVEPAPAVFGPNATVSEVVEALREAVRQTLISYIFIVDQARKLLGVVAFRELVFAEPDAPMSAIMIADPFYLKPETDLVEAMQQVVTRHYPAYPVCDDAGRLIGMVRGGVLFEQQAYEISAQAGSMVGVEKEERTTTTWLRSLKFRHPWLQLNLFTAFIAGSVVGVFQDTINRIVLLAVFIPILSGQSGNTGCQALAVTLRGMTLNELRGGRSRALMIKEAWLGLLNGSLVGVVAGTGMFIIARMQHNPQALMLGLITIAAMAGSCLVSGVAGAAVPLALKRLGADPATASSIFLTTATDVVSMTLFLGMATFFIH